MLLLYFIKPDLGQFFESRLTGQRIIQTLINRHEIRGCGDVVPATGVRNPLGDATFFIIVSKAVRKSCDLTILR